MLIIWPNFSHAGLNFLCLVPAFRRMPFLISSKTISEKEIRGNYINHTRSLHSFLFVSCCVSKSTDSKAKKSQPKLLGTENLSLVQFSSLGQEGLYHLFSFPRHFILLSPDQPHVNRTKDSLLHQIKWLFTLSFFMCYQHYTYTFVGFFKQIYIFV